MTTLLLDPPAASLRTHGLPGKATTTAAGAAAGTAAKAARTQTRPVPGPASVTSAPTRTVTTPCGTIAYRMAGTGSPLLLIMGFGGTMSTWDPRFVDALAARHRVVIFNNAGIGGTSPLAGRPSVRAMAEQTSALITALGLGRVDVLGWSMGASIAPALAVLHPEQVGRLVLAAGWPGDGSTVRPSRQAVADFSARSAKTSAAAAMSFAGQPDDPPAPASVLSAQAKALLSWWAGRDPAGLRFSAITAPTLVAAGTDDCLVPVANSRTMAGLIDGARLVLYPDGRHEFLFQYRASFVPLIESFLAGPGSL